MLFSLIQLLYYINLSSEIICCVFSGDICLSFGISINVSSVGEVVFGLLHDAVFVILLSSYKLVTASAILLPIKSLVASAIF